MSNQEAATIYESIIDELIRESRQDFEDNGIDEQTLQDLRTLWRTNLEKTGVAQFSWMDPSGATNTEDAQMGVKKETGNETFTMDHGKIEDELLKQKQQAEKRERTLASLDSDDINSDLDDSDDENASDDEADGDGMIILCLYEKVLRVKNKWKCNLKDGIAYLNGKDYAFSKATGEAEWF